MTYNLHMGWTPGQPTWPTLAFIVLDVFVICFFHTKMATPNLGSFPANPNGLLSPGSNAESQLGFSVVHLSNINLNKDQIWGTGKGPNLLPQPRFTRYNTHIWNDHEEFFRWLRIKRYFDEVLIEDSKRSPFRVKTTWPPAEGPDNLLDIFVKPVKLDLLSRDPKLTKHSNLTKNRIHLQRFERTEWQPSLSDKKSCQRLSHCSHDH